jgi:hypothetical protein
MMIQRPYRFESFTSDLIEEFAAFHAGPAAGQPLPEFQLATTDGGSVGKGSFRGKPLLIAFGSFT